MLEAEARHLHDHGRDLHAGAFCNVATGKPGALNPHEPANIAEAVGKLGLGHVVVTSVDRDDLLDGGQGTSRR